MTSEPTKDDGIDDETVQKAFEKLDRDAEAGGYHLNPDTEFTKELVMGLLINERRYGYQACPCRISEGDIDEDRDIICPCDYRDADLDEYGSCYCALYVDDDIKHGRKRAAPIPERRPPREERARMKKESVEEAASTAPEVLTRLKYPIWRCTVCGYLCARDEPPLVCPVCKAKKDRFERFL